MDFSITLEELIVTSLPSGILPSAFHPAVGMTIREHDFTKRTKSKAIGGFSLNTPLHFGDKNVFSLRSTAVSPTETICLEIWDVKLIGA